MVPRGVGGCWALVSVPSRLAISGSSSWTWTSLCAWEFAPKWPMTESIWYQLAGVINQSHSVYLAVVQWRLLSGGHWYMVKRSSHFMPTSVSLSTCLPPDQLAPHLLIFFLPSPLTSTAKPFTTTYGSFYISYLRPFLFAQKKMTDRWQLCLRRGFCLATVSQPPLDGLLTQHQSTCAWSSHEPSLA